MIAPFELGEGQRHGEALFLLLRVVIHDRANPAYRPGSQQHGLGQRGLARAAVADEHHVADLRGRVGLHERTPKV